MSLIEVKGLTKSYGDVHAVRGVDLSIEQGEIFSILGPNGAGKSTFLKIISGEMDPTSGHIHLEPGKRMSVLNQNQNAFDDEMRADFTYYSGR